MTNLTNPEERKLFTRLVQIRGEIQEFEIASRFFQIDSGELHKLRMEYQELQEQVMIVLGDFQGKMTNRDG